MENTPLSALINNLVVLMYQKVILFFKSQEYNNNFTIALKVFSVLAPKINYLTFKIITENIQISSI
jgi:hypothetical protein